MNSITSFSGEYKFLSNFWAATVVLDGEIYHTVEAAYQAAKTNDLSLRKKIRTSPSPGAARLLGRAVPLRPDWEQVKLSVMENFLRQKFSPPRMKAALANTRGFTLIEGNTWGDTFWGVCKGKGENHLGKLLMKIRDEIEQGERL